MALSPTSRDWSTLPNDVSFDQASGLPESANIAIGRMPITLDKASEFPTWLKSISQTLKAYGLQHLIDIQTPRPKRNDPNAGKWLHLSRLVKKWLEQGTSEDLVMKIKASGKRVELADEFIDQAKRVCEGSRVNADMENIASFLSIRRSDFTSTAEFVCSFRDKYLKIEGDGIGIPAYLAFFMLLDQLERDDQPTVTAMITMIHEKTIDKDNWRIFKPKDFQKVCEKILEPLDKVPTPSVKDVVPRVPLVSHASAVSHFPAPTESLIDVSVVASDTKLHSPAPGVSPEQHVKAWCERQPQVNDLGQCTYCTYPYHGPAKCFYLNPYLRPLDWKPVDNMWIYKPELNSGRRQWTKNTRLDGPSSGMLDSLLTQFDKAEIQPAAKEDSDTSGISAKVHPPHETLLMVGHHGFLASRQDWQVVTTFSRHVAADRALLAEYREYQPGETVFEWVWSTGQREKALGTGKAKIPLRLADGSVKDILVDCVYQPKCRFSIFSTNQARKDLGVSFDMENLTLFHFPHGDLKVFGAAIEENGIPFLCTSTFRPKGKEEMVTEK